MTILNLTTEKFKQLKEQLYNLKFETEKGVFLIDTYFGFTIYETFDNDFYLLEIVAAKECATNEPVSMYKHTFKILKTIVDSNENEELFIKDVTIYPKNLGETFLHSI